jgi:hypothetical protein
LGLGIISPWTGQVHQSPFDLILVGTKSYSLNEAMEQFAAAVGVACGHARAGLLQPVADRRNWTIPRLHAV